MCLAFITQQDNSRKHCLCSPAKMWIVNFIVIFNGGKFPFLLFCLRLVTHKVLKLIFKMLNRSALVLFARLRLFIWLRALVLCVSPTFAQRNWVQNNEPKNLQIKHYSPAYCDEDTAHLKNMTIFTHKYTGAANDGGKSGLWGGRACSGTCGTEMSKGPIAVMTPQATNPSNA